MLNVQKAMSEMKCNLLDSSHENVTNFSALSPTISQIDHQEVVETDYQSDNCLPTSGLVTDKAVHTSSFDLQLNKEEGDSLFSFELDTHVLPLELLNKDSCIPDFDWTDLLLDDSNESVSLEDITPSYFSKCKQIENEKVKQTNCQRISLINYFNPIPKSSSEPKIIQQKLLYSSSIHSFSNCLNNNRNQQVSNSSEANVNFDLSDNDMNDLYNKDEKTPCLNNDDLHNGKPGQCVKLTTEERKLLQKIGCQLPIKFPLSQTNEKAIRTVRRKIRNKLSAQASRAKRQKYVIDLERRYSLCTEEIKQLRRQIYELEEDKRSLTLHLRKLRSYINKFICKQNKQSYLPLFVNSKQVDLNNNNKVTAKQAATAAAGGTSLLVMTFMILIWTAVVPIPSGMKSFNAASSSLSTESLLNLFPGRSRMLMSIDPEFHSSFSSTKEAIHNESKIILLDSDITEKTTEYIVPLISTMVTEE
ncbi:Cyclic AMP-responsive element-binding protein 3-like protein [Schistosoma japonicum]|uniref:Cyclic AMP-responsive element-binding protein 3-like protein n=1 Tax=Schistosoma japonicum TaxID=6182 RepID=A0A4Z2CV33_SCHJA|nr:Cyclic AMP-responsive element-binding protein 3-like protein 4 [Schistosoma japonicum]TNN07968.1 Cyclic AMP-responsive element-binding protein 3-like protein [Schistosoma japonicum]